MRPAWRDAPGARALVLAAVKTDMRLSPTRVLLIADAVDLFEGRRAAAYVEPGPRRRMADHLVACGYLEPLPGRVRKGGAMWVRPGPKAEAIVAPFRGLAGFGKAGGK